MPDLFPKPTPQILKTFEGYLPSEQLLDPNHLGPLALLPGKWHGSHGLNTITLPSQMSRVAGPGQAKFGSSEIDQINFYDETMVFEVLPGLTPNRGSAEDQFVSQVKYTTDVTEQGTNIGLHFENGLFLNRGTADDTEPARMVRQCSVPHGNSVLCRGLVHSVFEGAPSYPTVTAKSNVRGFEVAIPGSDMGHLELRLTDALAAEGLTVDGGVHLHFDTNWSEEINATTPGIDSDEIEQVHAIGSIPFVSNNATTTTMTADFFILRVTDANGNKGVRLQYLQTIMLRFFGIDWPHVGLNSLQPVPDREAPLVDDAPTFTAWAVENAIEALHGRRPSPSQLQRWVREIDDSNGTKWQAFVEELMTSPRYLKMEAEQPVEARVERYYQFLLGRTSDPAGAQVTIEEINEGRAATRITAMLIGAEAQAFFRSLFALD